MQQKQTSPYIRLKKAITAAIAVVVLIGFYTPVYADEYDEKIKAVNAEIAAQNQRIGELRAQGDTLRNQTQIIRSEIAAAQHRLRLAQAEYDQLTVKLDKAQADMLQRRQALAANVRAIYQEGQTTGLEILASSRSLGDFIDKQQYMQSIRDSIQESVREIAALKVQLEADRKIQKIRMSEQAAAQDALNERVSQLETLIAQTRGEEATYRSLAASNKEKVRKLKEQQQAALAARYANNMPTGGASCGGGYPADRPSPSGMRWGCNYAQDNTWDNWGMYNRQCVSYTAYKVAASGRYMPYWGGVGHAWQWPGNARRAGIPVDNNPRVGDVAIIPKSWDVPYGHAMYVERVYDNGDIFVSQYNINWQGEYSTMKIPKAGIEFIHF